MNTRIILHLLGPWLIIFFFLSTLHAQQPIRYVVSAANCHHHELNIRVTFPALPLGSLEIRMPNASPGRYAAHNFAKNVYDLKAVDGAGESLTVQRIAPTAWEIAGHDGTVELEYILYANHANGTYSGVDNRKLHLNMPATFLYGLGMDERPIELSFDLKDKDWTVATQLETLDKYTFRAPNYYYFYDSPTIVGDLQFRRWTSESHGKKFTIEIAMIHEGTEEELDSYTEWVKRIVEEQKSIYGSLPDFDFGRYTFLLSYNPWVNGDGMEHRNSTICTSQGNLKEHSDLLIGTVSHEFFHTWNVERIRPNSLEPFDFDHANMSGELWFAEGFTSYYDDLVLCRAGIISAEEYVEGLSNTMTYVLNFPGRRYHGPIQMSFLAPFTDAASAIDEFNQNNIFISYYTYGALIGLCMDLSIRKKFRGKSLDDLMRYLWEKYGKTEIPYEIVDLERALATVTGDADFARHFFESYIYQSQLPDLHALLSEFGITLDYRWPGKIGFLDGKMKKVDEGFQLQQMTLKGYPLYNAGMNKGDIILSMAGRAAAEMKNAKALRKGLELGKTYPIIYKQNGIIVESEITLTQDPILSCQLSEEVLDKISKKVLKRRNAWLKRN